MKKHFKNLTIFLIIISFVLIFSACTADTGITIHGGETSAESESTYIYPETGKIETEAITDIITDTEESTNETSAAIETQNETEYAPTTEKVTEPIESDTFFEESSTAPEAEITPEETTSVPESETLPEETTSDTETAKETEAETTQKVENENQTEYLLNTNTKKFHYLSCKSGQRTKESNRAYHKGARDEIIAKGYVPCKVCNP